jgi:protein SCO1/2
MMLFVALCVAPALAADLPSDASDFAWATHPGAQVPLDTELRDEAGRPATLGQFVHGAPVILDLGYFHCPTLCGVVRADLLNALGGSGLKEARDYTLVSVSIDPAETPADAASAKQADLAQAPFATGRDWHYLTGGQDQVAAIAGAVGFRDRYDPQLKQFLHPTGLAVLTPAGVVSGYLLGVGYSPGDLRAAVLRARGGGIARDVLPILLICFHFDSTTGRYSLEVMKVLRLAGLLTVLTLAGLVIVLRRR